MLPHLTHGGRTSVAITGSAARGNSTAASDLDLWLIGPHSDRQHFTVARTPVTLLRQRPKESLTLDTLCLYEVADAIVLDDARGYHAKVKKAASRRAAEVRKEVVSATWDGVRQDIRLLDDVSDWQRTLALRHLAFRLAATWLYLRTGWRVPRLRALREHLSPRPLRTLESLLGVPVSEKVARRAVACLVPAVRAARGAPVPAELKHRLAAKDWDEAILLARRFLRRELLPPLLNRLGLRDVRELSLHPRFKAVLDAVRITEGLGARPQSRRIARQVARLSEQLELVRLFPRDVRRAR